MASAVQTPAEMRELLVTIIVGTTGGEAEAWRAAVGDVQKLPIAANVCSNWRVRPGGTKAQEGVIRRAVEIVRAAHPYVAS